MRCDRVRGLFGAYWDDETTQAEREILEAHFTSCEGCRREYEAFSRALELTASLPRIEAAPDLVDRVLQRARRAAPAPDGVLRRAPRWVAVGAAASLLMLAGATLLPWVRIAPNATQMAQAPAPQPLREPVLVSPGSATTPGAGAPSHASRRASAEVGSSLAALSDSLFDHSEDVEFILDPVTLRRGHAHAVTSAPAGVRAERAVVSF